MGVVVQVACGHNHSLALDEVGKCYAWGRGQEGQLGIGSLEDQPAPALIAKVDQDSLQHESQP